jgi:hypothetical protein
MKHKVIANKFSYNYQAIFSTSAHVGSQQGMFKHYMLSTLDVIPHAACKLLSVNQ